MNLGRTVFSQLMEHLPSYEFQKCVARYRGDSYRRGFSWLANANERHDWRIYAGFAQVLIGIARPLDAHDPIGVDLAHSLYPLDSTTIDLCLSLFPWAQFRKHKAAGVRSDHTVILTAIDSAKAYPDPLRRVTHLDVETRKRFQFLTNNFTLPALAIAQVHQCRCQVILFFKWINQHLRIKAFYGTSGNVVKTQIWIEVSVYVLVAIVRKRLELEASLHQILQILSVTPFEKTPVLRALPASDFENDWVDSGNQLILFDF
jgi:hypothetical protein